MDPQIWDSDLSEKRQSGTYPCHFVKSACVSHQCGKDQAAAENGHLDENHFQIAQTHTYVG